ncbi:MAG: HAD hydrolase-like protein [Deltaproteobacteria bacterium]|nr:HAD hydrolase-like protein [Deltaproteobacteria bacterium]
MNLELIKTQIEKAKALVFDFDGTLVDSNAIKQNAFAKCFFEYPKQLDAIMVYCNSYNNIPRVVKFRHVFENILKLPYPPEVEQLMLDRYASETTEQVIGAAEIPGAIRFLKKVASKKETALLSSTPHEFLLRILERRGLKKYFGRIQGAPVDKKVWLENYVGSRGFSKTEVLFFGDSPEDVQAATGAQVPFIGVGMRSEIQYVIASFESLL